MKLDEKNNGFFQMKLANDTIMFIKYKHENRKQQTISTTFTRTP